MISLPQHFLVGSIQQGLSEVIPIALNMLSKFYEEKTVQFKA